jgi:predicted alpha-1,6-mannanase (GH76 family)
MVNDGLTADCANNGGTAWTYNQGVIAGGLTVLHEITGDSTCLRQAEAIATAALRDLTVPPGILTEPGEWRGASRGADQAQFKGIFVRNLYELYRRSPRAEYRDFILANATSLWHRSRNRRNQVGLAWTGPFDRADPVRQGSALDALNAAVGVTDPGAMSMPRSGEGGSSLSPASDRNPGG